MTEDEAKKVEFVRAIEVEDPDGLFFTREDREQAEAHARTQVRDMGRRRGEARFIAARADFAASRLATRHTGIAALLEPTRWSRWFAVLLPLVAVGAGLLANEFGTAKRLDLLAAPLLGTVAWNLLIYLWLIGSALTGRGRVSAAPLAELVARADRRSFDGGSAIDRAAASFRRRWAVLTAPLAHARLARTLHLGAAMFAVGLDGRAPSSPPPRSGPCCRRCSAPRARSRAYRSPTRRVSPRCVGQGQVPASTRVRGSTSTPSRWPRW